MFVAVALIELHIEYAQSLKEKRMVVRSLRDRVRAEFHISIAEVALQDLHQRARLALSFVALERDAAAARLDKISQFVESTTDATLVGFTSELLDFDENAIGDEA
jgi:uncharacterized protein YlxP (DUF503 family)